MTGSEDFFTTINVKRGKKIKIESYFLIRVGPIKK